MQGGYCCEQWTRPYIFEALTRVPRGQKLAVCGVVVVPKVLLPKMESVLKWLLEGLYRGTERVIKLHRERG